MSRKSFVPGAALVAAAALAVGLAGCSDGSSTDGSATDAKSGDATSAVQSAEPGRYQTLPEACGLPSRNSLRSMLPGDGQQLSSAEAKKLYAGQADITYDTDRRVGCRWSRETTRGTRHLTLDIQRVVSYDAEVSDDDKAQGIYAGKQQDAQIPSGGSASPGTPPPSSAKPKGPTADGAASASGAPVAKDSKTGGGGNGTDDGKSSTTGKAADQASGKATPGTPEASTPGAAPSGSIAPRVLDDLGDAAFLNDKLVTADSGLHRDVTVVFRTSNVIVTLTYDQWSTDKSMVPDSQELQDKARSLAGELSDRLSE
ncbi:hypothetical protein [Streptomyces sp. NPDC020742]|uniref:hypothetical protein n=1 Tax=Streptomyces sp. NPDC020742 TaxID=3154897 RepID=UPI0033E7CB3C